MLGLKKKPAASNNASTSAQSSTTSSSASTNITATLSTLGTNSSENATYSAAKISNYDFLDKLLKCMNALIEIATQSNRNVIIDQVSREQKLLSDSFLIVILMYCLSL